MCSKRGVSLRSSHATQSTRGSALRRPTGDALVVAAPGGCQAAHPMTPSQQLPQAARATFHDSMDFCASRRTRRLYSLMSVLSSFAASGFAGESPLGSVSSDWCVEEGKGRWGGGGRAGARVSGSDRGRERWRWGAALKKRDKAEEDTGRRAPSPRPKAL